MHPLQFFGYSPKLFVGRPHFFIGGTHLLIGRPHFFIGGRQFLGMGFQIGTLLGNTQHGLVGLVYGAVKGIGLAVSLLLQDSQNISHPVFPGPPVNTLDLTRGR